MNQSEQIVSFIAGLLPLYVHERCGNASCARSLADGTLVLPIERMEDDDDPFVVVYWQGDPQRKSIVQGVFFASIAVVKYVELIHSANNSAETKQEVEHLSHHFTVKTGASLCFDGPTSSLLAVVGVAVSRFGESVVIEVLKKQLGM